MKWSTAWGGGGGGVRGPRLVKVKQNIVDVLAPNWVVSSWVDPRQLGSLKVKENSAKCHETSYMTSYPIGLYLAQFSTYRGQNSFGLGQNCYHGGQKTNMAAMSPFLKSHKK